MFKVVDLFCETGALSYGLCLSDDRFHVVAGLDYDPDASEVGSKSNPIFR